MVLLWGPSIEVPNDAAHESHDNSIGLRVRALQSIGACKMVRHKPGIRTYDLHKAGSGLAYPNYGNPGGPAAVSAGGYMWNGRSASEEGGG
jgi:hypothetical protein